MGGGGALRADLHPLLANVAWMTAAVLIFLILFRQARARGLLLQVGE